MMNGARVRRRLGLEAERGGIYFGFVAMTILARGCEINVLVRLALR